MAVGFFSRSSWKLAEETLTKGRQCLTSRGGSSSLCVMASSVTHGGVYLNECLKEGMIDSLVQSDSTKHGWPQTHPWLDFSIYFFFVGGEVKGGRVIKCRLLSASIMAGSDITATGQSEGNKELNPTLISSCSMPLAGIRTRLRSSAPCVLCGVLYIHKHNYSGRQAHRKYNTARRKMQHVQVHFSCCRLSLC